MQFKSHVALFLVLIMTLQFLSGCSSRSTTASKIPNEYNETIIDEEFYRPSSINENNISERLVRENLIYEENGYELIVDEHIICEAYTIETIVNQNTEEYIRSQLPLGFENYDIDWPSVVGKFAAGTAIIIVVGVVAHYTKGATYYFFASPAKVAKDSVIGGATFAALNVVKNTKDGKFPEEAIKKYAIEGFADGYMWGAIASVGSTLLKNLKLPNKLKFANGTSAKISLDGSVANSAGQTLGNAYVDKSGIFIRDEASKTIKYYFNLKGKQRVGTEMATVFEAGKLPPNSILQLGSKDSAKVYATDAAGNIFKVNGELLKNTKYTLNGVQYETDGLGRIVKVTFDHLQSKSHSGRLPIANTADEIGRGFQKVGDDRGHLIADQFGGDNTLANIVSMNSKLNQGAYKEMETVWAEAIANGDIVSGTINILYDETSFRPSSFEVAYSIGKELFKEIFLNQ